MARRRAALTQRGLAERLGCRQATIARWERGDRQPSFEDVCAVVEACGLQLDIHLVAEDRSWWPQIASQLACEPAERVRRLTPPGAFDAVPVLEALADTQARAIVIGEIAGALHGWPLVLGGNAIEVCARAGVSAMSTVLECLVARRAAFENAYDLPQGGQLILTEVPSGTAGFADLARGAETIQIGDGAVMVAGLLDLLRIADASPEGVGRRQALAYGAVLDVERARRQRRAGAVLTDDERIREWLSRQAPVA